MHYILIIYLSMPYRGEDPHYLGTYDNMKACKSAEKLILQTGDKQRNETIRTSFCLSAGTGDQS